MPLTYCTGEKPVNASRSTITALTALAASMFLTTAAVAQTSATKPTAKATKSAAKAPATKAAPAPVEAPLPDANGAQLAAADMAHYGDYVCDFDQAVNVAAAPKKSGYVDVHFKKQSWTMKPVLSSTGALRLEDVKGQMLMLQIANKSMLMDTKIGQRLVDGCVHEKQRIATAAAAGQPAGEALLQDGTALSSAPQ